MKKQVASGDKIDVDFYPNFLEQKSATNLLEHLEAFAKWTKPITRQARTKVIYADEGIVYKAEYHGQVFENETQPWLDAVAAVRDLVTSITGEKYNVCIVQRYPNGGVGIAPHKDKEMKEGTTIAGVSLGETRILTIARGDQSIAFPLVSGSLYVLNPPTNTYWTHCIEKDDKATGVRISLTFRNYPV